MRAGAMTHVAYTLQALIHCKQKVNKFSKIFSVQHGVHSKILSQTKRNKTLWVSVGEFAQYGQRPEFNPQQILKCPYTFNVYGPIHYSVFIILDIMVDLKQDKTEEQITQLCPTPVLAINTPLFSVPRSQLLQKNLHWFGCLLFCHLVVREPH